MFNLKPKSLLESETEEMQQLWNAFERNILWPQQWREDELHPKDCTMVTCKHPDNPQVRTKLEEIYSWEAFAKQTYGTPIEEIRWT